MPISPGSGSPTWSNEGTVLTIALPTLAYSQTYTVTIEAADDEGDPLIPGPVPNPWSFTTVEPPPPVFWRFLPLINK